jgi:hypothetical protein
VDGGGALAAVPLLDRVAGIVGEAVTWQRGRPVRGSQSPVLWDRGEAGLFVQTCGGADLEGTPYAEGEPGRSGLK